MNDAPLVLGLHPSRGWACADEAHQQWAALCVVLVGSWTLLQVAFPTGGGALTVLTAVTVGPRAFWAAARVLRPDPRPGTERRYRHALSATGGCFGTATVLSIATQSGLAAVFLAAPATLLLLVTLPWGVVALVVRAARTPLPYDALRNVRA